MLSNQAPAEPRRRQPAHPRAQRTLPRAASACRPFFFFQAEDGIRDLTVTGVQTCALPIYLRQWVEEQGYAYALAVPSTEVICVQTHSGCLRSSVASIAQQALRARDWQRQIGRASCRERV